MLNKEYVIKEEEERYKKNREGEKEMKYNLSYSREDDKDIIKTKVGGGGGGKKGTEKARREYNV